MRRLASAGTEEGWSEPARSRTRGVLLLLCATRAVVVDLRTGDGLVEWDLLAVGGHDGAPLPRNSVFACYDSARRLLFFCTPASPCVAEARWEGSVALELVAKTWVAWGSGEGGIIEGLLARDEAVEVTVSAVGQSILETGTFAKSSAIVDLLAGRYGPNWDASGMQPQLVRQFGFGAEPIPPLPRG